MKRADRKELIGKVISWTDNYGEGWIRHRVSKVEVREFKFSSSTKTTNYRPIPGDRVAFRLSRSRDGYEYANDVQYIMTGN